MTELAEARYASGWQIFADAAEALLPPERVTVAEHAAKHRWLANEGGGYVGRWQHTEVPYLRGPMESLSSRMHRTTAIVGPGQCGKTSVAENWLLKSVDVDPADMLWYMQTDQAVEAYVKDRIDAMIEQHDELRERQGLRPVDDSLHFKRFRGMSLQFLSATRSNLINKRAPRIIADEVDAYDESFGDVKAQLDVRRQTYGDESHLLAMSHCDRATGLDPEMDWGRSGIMAIYADSDRRVWYWACPHCGGHSSPAPIAKWVMTIGYPEKGSLDEIQAEARLVCPHGGCLIEDKHRRAMNLAGRWIGLGQEIDEYGRVTGELIARNTAGFWIHGAMSPFLLDGIGGLARARAKAEREAEASGDDDTLRQVMVKQWGEPYGRSKAVGSIDANTLAERAEGETDLKLGVLPELVRFLTAAVDVQAGYFEVLVRGWGLEGESAVVDHYKLDAHPALAGEDWDQLLGTLAAKRYPLGTGNVRGMAIRAIGYDSAGAPGVTDQAYAAFGRMRQKGAAQAIGKIDGRDVWTLLPMKGASGPSAPRLQVVYPDTVRKDRKVVRTGAVPLALFNANQFKDSLAAQLGVGLPGPRYVHFPPPLRSEQKPHVFFEQLVAEKRDRQGRWEKPQQGTRNEAMDLMVMTHALAHLHGLARLDWINPPAWAAPWERNSMVGEIAPAGAPPATSPVAGAPTEPKPSLIKQIVNRLA